MIMPLEHTVKVLIEAPEQVTSAPACIRDLASTGDPAFIKMLSACHTRVINFYIYT